MKPYLKKVGHIWFAWKSKEHKRAGLPACSSSVMMDVALDRALRELNKELR